MLRRNAGLARGLLVASTGILLLLGGAAGAGAAPPGLDSLEGQRDALAARSQGVVLELYSLETALADARRDLAQLGARAKALRRDREAARGRYEVAQRTLRIAQTRLGEQLRFLYKFGEPDPIEVLLGATSLEEAIEGLEGLSRTVRTSERVVDQTRRARTRVAALERALASRQREADGVAAAAGERAAALEQTQADRRAYLARIRSEQDFTAAQIASLQARAAAAQRASEQLAAQAQPAGDAETTTTAAGETTADERTDTAPGAATTEASPKEPQPDPVESIEQTTTAAPTPAAPPPRAGRTMTVTSTGYALKGTTATGLPVGPGIVAVDPSVIPLGTRMTVPGYGEAVAADTGGAVKGAIIDLWFPTLAQAQAWGTRTVTITLH